MPALDPNCPISRVLELHPELEPELRALGIAADSTSLADEAGRLGVDIRWLMEDLELSVAAPGQDVDFSSMSRMDLIRYIERRHHAYLRVEMPRLSRLMAGLGDAVGVAVLDEIREVFEAFRRDMNHHLDVEEQVLFAHLRSRNRAAGGWLLDEAEVEPGREGTAKEDAQRINLEAKAYRHMKREHDQVDHAMATLRRLTDDFAPPPGAPATIAAFYQALARLEGRLREHVQLENDFLWPVESRGPATGRSAKAAPPRGMVPGEDTLCPLSGQQCLEGCPARCRHFWECVRQALAKMQN